MTPPNNSPEPPPIVVASPHSRLLGWAAQLQLFVVRLQLHAMLKITGILASIVSAICLVFGLVFYQGPQGSGNIEQTVNFISLILYVSITFAVSFSLSFTPMLGVALLVRIKAPTQDYRKAVETFVVSLFPFGLLLWCFCSYILPLMLDYHRHHS